MNLTVAQLAERIGAHLCGEGGRHITGVGAVETCGENDVAFISDTRYVSKLQKSAAGAVIVPRRIERLSKPQLIVENVNSAVIKVLETFAPQIEGPPEGIDPAAKLGRQVTTAKGVRVGPGVVIEDNVQIAEYTVISSGAKIGRNSKIGSNCRIDCNVVIYHNCTIGNNVIIQANSTIGATGFGYYFIDGRHILIPHIGGVIIEDFVEIGANTCVDRAKFGNTIIGAGTKIDNLVQIAHNVRIGKSCLIAGMVGIGGSCTIGDGVILAGQVGLVDHVEVGDGAIVGGKSLVKHNVPPGHQVFGFPATEKSEAFKTISLTKRLPKLQAQLKKMQHRIKTLEDAIAGPKPASRHGI